MPAEGNGAFVEMLINEDGDFELVGETHERFEALFRKCNFAAVQKAKQGLHVLCLHVLQDHSCLFLLSVYEEDLLKQT